MTRPVRVDVPGASAEEVAAITAAITAIVAASAAAAPAPVADADPERLDAWVKASRLGARGAGMARGSWRLSGRIDRRRR